MSDSDVTTPVDGEGNPLLNPTQVATVGVLSAGAEKLRTLLKGAFAEDGTPTTTAKATLADVSIKASKAFKMTSDLAKAAIHPHQTKVDAIKTALKPLADAFKGLEKDAKEAAARIIEQEAEEQRRARARAEAEQAEARQRQEAAQKASLEAAAQGDLDTARTHEVEAAEAYMDRQDAKLGAPKGPVPNAVSGASGSLFGRQDWGWDIEDLDKVPDQYILRIVNEKAVEGVIKAAVAAGKDPAIPGLKFYNRTVMVNKPAKATGKKKATP